MVAPSTRIFTENNIYKVTQPPALPKGKNFAWYYPPTRNPLDKHCYVFNRKSYCFVWIDLSIYSSSTQQSVAGKINQTVMLVKFYG